nr:GAF domain-containing protein [uncultured Lacibacter sp.]
MLIAPLPKSEEIRLADLQLYDLLDTPEEESFDELRELAAQICNCPVSLITLLDKNRQWFKSKQGLDEKETSRDLAFCSHAILQDDVMVVEDATKDERFFDNPIVAGNMNVRFYAGAPIVSPTGQNLGTICVLDTKPGKLSPAQERALEILSGQVTKLLELRLKTKVIEQRANEMVRMGKQAVSQLIREQDEDNLSVAKELHENIAQELAASRLYLNLAVSNEAGRIQYIKEANASIGNALTEVKNLSYSIMPSTVDSVSVHVMMENLLHVHRSSYPFKVELHVAGHKLQKVEYSQAMNCCKITESWLQVLETQKDITEVNIHLQADRGIELCIEDNGGSKQVKSREKKLISSMVYYRVIGMNGNVRFEETEQGKNRLCVKFSLHEKDVY